MAELGWAGIPFDEKQGGAGMGLAELALVVEGPRPQARPRALHRGVTMGGSALALGGNDALATRGSRA